MHRCLPRTRAVRRLAVGDGGAEREHPSAEGADDPVAPVIGRRRDRPARAAGHRPARRIRRAVGRIGRSRPVEGRVTEVEDSAVAGDEPVPTRRADRAGGVRDDDRAVTGQRTAPIRGRAVDAETRAASAACAVAASPASSTSVVATSATAPAEGSASAQRSVAPGATVTGYADGRRSATVRAGRPVAAGSGRTSGTSGGGRSALAPGATREGLPRSIPARCTADATGTGCGCGLGTPAGSAAAPGDGQDVAGRTEDEGAPAPAGTGRALPCERRGPTGPATAVHAGRRRLARACIADRPDGDGQDFARRDRKPARDLTPVAAAVAEVARTVATAALGAVDRRRDLRDSGGYRERLRSAGGPVGGATGGIRTDRRHRRRPSGCGSRRDEHDTHAANEAQRRHHSHRSPTSSSVHPYNSPHRRPFRVPSRAQPSPAPSFCGTARTFCRDESHRTTERARHAHGSPRSCGSVRTPGDPLRVVDEGAARSVPPGRAVRGGTRAPDPVRPRATR